MSDGGLPEARHVVVEHALDYPVGLKNAAEMAAALSGALSEERLVQLAAAGYLPHMTVDGGPPLFRASQVKRWIAESGLVHVCAGTPYPREFAVYRAGECRTQPPASIAAVSGLTEVSATIVSGVYFLCRGAAVVYVGQSTNVISRIATHSGEGVKEFDRAYFVGVPRSRLDDVEAAFIRFFRPEYNGRVDGRPGGTMTTNRSTLDPAEVVREMCGIHEDGH